MVVATEKTYTVAEFLALPDDEVRGCELLNGRIIKKRYWRDTEYGMNPRSLNHSRTMRVTASALDDFVEPLGLGEVLITPSFLVGADRDQSRKPDVAFVAGPMPTDPEAILALVPTLAIEVISPNNTAEEMEAKVAEYLAAGTQMVWLTFPESRMVIAFWDDGGAVFKAGDTITAETVLPGFACPVTDLFPRPANLTR
ncbi:MAG: Uma2 family endonuclease [Chloroflexota bacterium]|nr:Uma2 family endonuclease [Chloroflexota bacterium]